MITHQISSAYYNKVSWSQLKLSLMSKIERRCVTYLFFLNDRIKRWWLLQIKLIQWPKDFKSIVCFAYFLLDLLAISKFDHVSISHSYMLVVPQGEKRIFGFGNSTGNWLGANTAIYQDNRV